MPIPDGWPAWLIRHLGKHLTADTWLVENFECDRSTTTIQEVNNIKVSRVAHYKNATGDWRHEFIVVTLLDGSRGDAAPAAPLYLKYERFWAEVEDDKKQRSKVESSTISSIAVDQPVQREDIITPWAPSEIDKLNRAVKQGKKLLLREMTFPSNPTVLDLVIVLEAHSTLSKEYRLYATMCYWYAGSTYKILEHLYGGQNNFQHANKAGKFGIMIGYREIREKQDAQDIGSLVGLVKQQFNNKKNPVPEEELEAVAKAELERIPKFETLLQRCIKRKDQVITALERRESERIRIEAKDKELEARDRELALERAGRAADQQKLEQERAGRAADQQELEQERVGRAADQQKLEAIAREREEEQAEMKRLREQLEALQPAGSSSK